MEAAAVHASMQVMIVDDEPLARARLRALLDAQAGVTVMVSEADWSDPGSRPRTRARFVESMTCGCTPM